MRRRAFISKGLCLSTAAGVAPMLKLQRAWGEESSQPMVAKEPHFFLAVTIPGGVDATYTFDGRPLEMTKAGLQANYLGAEPEIYTGKNGQKLLMASTASALEPHLSDLAVINGVLMSPGFDGHDQNLYKLFSGNEFGGNSFLPILNQKSLGVPRIIDALEVGQSLYIQFDNYDKVVRLTAGASRRISQLLESSTLTAPKDPLFHFVESRLRARAGGQGRFAQSAKKLHEAYGNSRALAAVLKDAQPESTGDGFESALELIKTYFKGGIVRTAELGLSVNDFFMDTHAATDAKKIPEGYPKYTKQIAEVFDFLKATPYDERRSLFDVTTVMVSSEFSRTMRIEGSAIDDTGTNHNALTNTIILAGKGIRGGYVLGKSDFNSSTEKLSATHLKLDPKKEKQMSMPFDFNTFTVRSDLPQEFKVVDYLTVDSVVNTLYCNFSVPTTEYRTLGRSLPAAPILKPILKNI